ncbi:MAG: hypothetical protein Q9163_002449 [Psora crenata]
MTPRIGTSVRRLDPARWLLGSSKLCERVTTPLKNPDAIVSWLDGDDIYYIRDVEEQDILLPQDGLETGLVHEGGTSAAVWSIGTKAFCKRSQIASQVAACCAELAGITSLTFGSASGRGGVVEPFLEGPDEGSHPSWEPRPLGPLSITECATYLRSILHVDIGPSLHFCHADLGPGNIMVSKEGNVEAILDWESAGFYPRLWIASKPMLSAGFYLHCEGFEREAWGDLLRGMLEKEGYKPVTFQNYQLG